MAEGRDGQSSPAKGNMDNSEIMSKARQLYSQARVTSPASEAESLTRCVLVLQGVCEPYASRYAKDARRNAEAQAQAA